MTTSRFAILLVVSALVLPSSIAFADTQIGDQLVARVDGHAIFLSELRTRARPRLKRDSDTQKVYATTLEDRIEEEIVRALGASLHITIGDAEVNDAIGRWAKEYHLTTDSIIRRAVAEGFTADEYRAEVRRMLLKQRVIWALGARDKSAGAYPDDDAARSAWFTRVENGAFAREKRKACVERFVRW